MVLGAAAGADPAMPRRAATPGSPTIALLAQNTCCSTGTGRPPRVTRIPIAYTASGNGSRPDAAQPR
ncbi:hypothetical protein LP419_01095 [Massilia sp. H-1]|nr:hypothetical protein LP419_01095 [Massilia sp. H-1]